MDKAFHRANRRKQLFGRSPLSSCLQAQGRQKTFIMPVPGTGTFVWWEGQIDPSLVFGIPMGGWRTPDGKFCENNQLEPDIKINNDAEIMNAGGDQQFEAAVA